MLAKPEPNNYYAQPPVPAHNQINPPSGQENNMGYGQPQPTAPVNNMGYNQQQPPFPPQQMGNPLTKDDYHNANQNTDFGDSLDNGASFKPSDVAGKVRIGFIRKVLGIFSA